MIPIFLTRNIIKELMGNPNKIVVPTVYTYKEFIFLNNIYQKYKDTPDISDTRIIQYLKAINFSHTTFGKYNPETKLINNLQLNTIKNNYNLKYFYDTINTRYQLIKHILNNLYQTIWNQRQLPIIISVLQSTKQSTYNPNQFQQLRIISPTKCCYCLRGMDDFNYQGTVAGTPALIWLTQHHEKRCSKKPCHLANLPKEIIKYILTFIIDNKKSFSNKLQRFTLKSEHNFNQILHLKPDNLTLERLDKE